MLSIYVFDHPELFVPCAQVAWGFLVQSDGNLAYLFLKSAPTAGQTVEGFRQGMRLGMAKFFTDPQLHISAVPSKQTQHLS